MNDKEFKNYVDERLHAYSVIFGEEAPLPPVSQSVYDELYLDLIEMAISDNKPLDQDTVFRIFDREGYDIVNDEEQLKEIISDKGE